MKRLLCAFLAFLWTLLPFGTCHAGPEEAYMLVFQEELGRNDRELKYVAVDLSKIKLEDTTKLIELLQAYCDENGATLLLDDFNGLKEKGYIKEHDDLPFSYVEDGILVTFDDVKLTKNSLVTRASSSTVAGWKFEVKRIHGEWQIVSRDLAWIS